MAIKPKRTTRAEPKPETQRRAAGGKERPATGRTLALLEAAAAAGRPASLKELTAICDLPAATAFRLCGRLEDQGYLVRAADSRRYTIGARLMRLGLDIVRSSGPSRARHSILSDLVETFGETCNLTCFSGDDVLYIDRVETKWPLRIALEPGSHVPIHCTASGKLFLAHMPAKLRERVLSSAELTAHAPNTIVDADLLRAELQKIVRRGYSTDNEEFLAGLVAVAEPVRDAQGRVFAAIACHAPVARMTLQDLVARRLALEQAARAMAETFE